MPSPCALSVNTKTKCSSVVSQIFIFYFTCVMSYLVFVFLFVQVNSSVQEVNCLEMTHSAFVLGSSYFS